jgi:hypothetical protein
VLSLGTCVACSAAFPPVFPPVRIEREKYAFSQPVYGEPPLPPYPLIPVNDGGVYDNSGVEALIKPVALPGLAGLLEPAELLIVSEAGAPAKYRFSSAGLPGLGDALLLYRVDEIAREQVTALRARSLMSELGSGKRQGLFVSLKSEVSHMGTGAFEQYCAHVDRKFLIPTELLVKIRGIRTSLDRFSKEEAVALMYHAYVMTDAFLWCYRNTFSGLYRVNDEPDPKWLIDFTPVLIDEWREALRKSDSVFRMR